MAKAFDFQWRIPVPERLQKGDICERWDEVSYPCERLYLQLLQFLSFVTKWSHDTTGYQYTLSVMSVFMKLNAELD